MYLINISYLLSINLLVFYFGIVGLIVIRNSNSLIMLMAIELLLLTINLNFIVFSIYLDDLGGQIFVLFILAVSATESVVGLALIAAYYRIKGSINFNKLK